MILLIRYVLLDRLVVQLLEVTRGHEFLLKILEHDEEHRHDEEQGDGSDEHTAHGSHTDRDITVGTHTRSEHQRQHTEDHRKRGHQDGAQTYLCCRDCGLRDTHAVVAALRGVLGKQDGRLGQKADKHEQTDLQVDVVLQTEHLGEEEASGQTERYRQDDGDGDEEALVEGAEDKVYEYDADDESSMSDNNSSAFNFRFISHTTKISKHGMGMAVDINTLYNPYVKTVDGELSIEPANGADYIDRSRDFSHKIDHDDLCYKLFTEHGFEWGGDWTHSKDYQHFEK